MTGRRRDGDPSPPWVLRTERLLLRNTREEPAWTIDVHYARDGYGLWAARAIADHAFATLPVDRLVVLIDPANAASRRVAEKIGMTVLIPDHVDEHGPCEVHALQRPVSRRTGG
jgi:[ribosomal protein S5]-alanine N-acetyltransferase